ncbi:MAG: purine-nucleoside phosphorylase, partial [Oscillibacter sp.]|nr:purine-nucleoside phosphorylase [Oscillibacter sp.]
LRLRDIVAAQAACTDSSYALQFGLPGTFAPIADFTLLETAAALARERGLGMKVGSVLSSDRFYDASGRTKEWGGMGVLCVEMETAALYCNAAYAHRRALSLLTVSDSLITGESLSPEERETSFTQMMELALETAVKLAAADGQNGEISPEN